MRRILLGFVLLVLSVIPANNAIAQMTLVACSRKVIASYPDGQARLVLQFLDEARPMGDEFMRILSEGNNAEIGRRYRGTEIWFNKEPGGGTQLELTNLLQTIGQPVRYDFHHQEVLYSLDRPQIDPGGTITTSYKLSTDRFDQLYILVQTRKTPGNESRVTAIIFYGKWAEDRFAEQQRVEASRMVCPGMEKGLVVCGNR